MDKIFNPDNPIMRLLSLFFDIILLNMILIICSIPLFTIGASLTAAYRTATLRIKGEESYICKDFFRNFKENFKESTILWVPLILIGIFLGFDLYVVFHYLAADIAWLQIPIWILLFLLVSVILYSFPQIAMFDTPTKQLIKNSVSISLANVPTTIFLLVLHLIPVFYAAFSGENLVFVFSLLLFFGFGAYAFLDAFFINHIFEKILKNQEEKAK